MTIKKIYLLSQTHTDLGYTDHLAAVLLHHRDILDQALNVCEESFDEPDGTQHRWTCEVTSTTLDYLRNTTNRNVERFQALHKAGRIAVGALRYHWTPLVSKPLAIQTLKDIEELRVEFGISVTSAMQCDVNGLAWFWNDLLVERGIDFLVTQQNPHRGYWGERVPSAWFWENRSGGRMLVLQGEHYGVGGSYLRLSRKGEQDKEELKRILERHDRSDCWPFDFSVITVTNAANGDNVFPDGHLSEAVRDWNDREEPPMEIITLDRLAEIVKQRSCGLGSFRGEWMDSWCDGVASSPLETAVARAAERLLPMIEAIDGDEGLVFRDLIDTLALYDEHTWGAHSAGTAPDNIFATALRTQKSNHAYRAFVLALRHVAVVSRKQAAKLGGPVEGDPGFDQFSHPTLTADEQAYLVANPGDVALEIDIPVPVDRGAGPQISIPQASASNEFFPGFGDDGWTDALQSKAPDGRHRIRARLAPGGAAIVRPILAEPTECSAGNGWIENAFARLETCPETGGLARWFDKTSGREVASGSTLVPLVQLMRPGFNRRQIFQAPYWERSGKPMEWNREDLFVDDVATVVSGGPSIDAGGASLSMRFEFRSGIVIDSAWCLTGKSAWPRLTAIQYARNVEQAFSIFWPISVPGYDRRILLDTGGGWIDCSAEHVPSSSLAWQCMQGGIALAEQPDACLVIASLDAPLFQPGPPRYRRPHDSPGDFNGGCFWSANTHWDTNFPTRIIDPAPFRLVLSISTERQSLAELHAMSAPHVAVRTPYLDETGTILNWQEPRVGSTE